MAKRLSDEEKKTIINSFTKGKTIDELAKEFYCTNLTIVRNLKKFLGEKKFKELSLKGKSEKNIFKSQENKIENNKNQKVLTEQKKGSVNKEEEYDARRTKRRGRRMTIFTPTGGVGGNLVLGKPTLLGS